MYSPTKMTFFTGLSNTNYVTTSTALVLIYFISTVGWIAIWSNRNRMERQIDM